ncbi:MAG: tRNA (guanosine(37)-N1)-methyltransferase TrmD, partial [Pseudomonadota bacterium]
ETVQLRDYADPVHRRIDSPPAGGGPGMILRADIVGRALDAKLDPDLRFVLPSPRGQRLDQSWCVKAAKSPGIAILCNRYQGIDERIIEQWQPEQISLGDFILAGGEAAALVMAESCIRLLDHVVGNSKSLLCESHSEGLLDHPHYTRPVRWRSRSIPEVLRSGHHEEIAKWRSMMRTQITGRYRLD